MCCEPTGHHGVHPHAGFDCCCGPHAGHHFRRHVSTRERIERLEAYRKQLTDELEGVAEALQELEGR
jgi:hypothetical protein